MCIEAQIHESSLKRLRPQLGKGLPLSSKFSEGGFSEHVFQNSSTHTSGEHCSQCSESQGFWNSSFVAPKSTVFGTLPEEVCTKRRVASIHHTRPPGLHPEHSSEVAFSQAAKR